MLAIRKEGPIMYFRVYTQFYFIKLLVQFMNKETQYDATETRSNLSLEMWMKLLKMLFIFKITLDDVISLYDHNNNLDHLMNASSRSSLILNPPLQNC